MCSITTSDPVLRAREHLVVRDDLIPRARGGEPGDETIPVIPQEQCKQQCSYCSWLIGHIMRTLKALVPRFLIGILNHGFRNLNNGYKPVFKGGRMSSCCVHITQPCHPLLLLISLFLTLHLIRNPGSDSLSAHRSVSWCVYWAWVATHFKWNLGRSYRQHTGWSTTRYHCQQILGREELSSMSECLIPMPR